MALFYSSGSREQGLGKFRESRKMGVRRDEQVTHGDYRFELLSMQSTSPVHGVRYHVSIYNRGNIRVGYLRDFTSAGSAVKAAKSWVAERELTNKK